MAEEFCSFSDDNDSLFLHNHKQYHFLLLHYANNLLWDKSDIEDVMQTTYLKIYTHIEKLQIMNERSMVNYIITIVKNTSFDYNRQKKKENYIKTCTVDIWKNNSMPSQDTIESSDLLEKYEKLKPIYRLPLELKIIYGLSNKKIATLLKVSETCVETRISRGKKLCRKI